MSLQRVFRPLIPFFLVLMLSGLVMASPQSYRIELEHRSFVPTEDPLTFFSNIGLSQPQAAIVQLYDHIPSSYREVLDEAGIHLQYYLNGGAWFAFLEPGVDLDSFGMARVRWVGELLPSDKLSRRVTAGEVPPWAENSNGKQLFAVRFMRPVSGPRAEEILENENAEIGDFISPLNAYYIALEPESISKIATYSEVLWISYPSPPMDVINRDARRVTRAEEVQHPPYNLTGDGVTVCVYDGGMVADNHPDFEGRVTHGEGGAVDDHPTHVAGSVAGNGGDAYRGMAPDALIVSYMYESCTPNCLYDSPQDIWENYSQALQQYGAEIATNSIGANIPYNNYPCDWQGDYELTSTILDSIVQGGLGGNLIVLFAAGNDRNPDRCGNAYETMGVPAAAKNIISVGATNDNDGMASFSSWGPVDDGRIKPEVCSPGVDIVSCLANGGHGAMSGTSMSTPITAGNVALMVQAYHENIEDATPSASLIKAIMCNSAEDLGNPGPDYSYGFGRTDAVRNIDTIIQRRFIEDQVADNQTWEETFYILPGQPFLKVTLAWTDEPAAQGAGDNALINDLDIRLTSPFGDTYLPYLLDPANPGDVAGTGVNDRDVVEQIYVQAPDEGYWSVIVTGTDVPVGPQPFSIAASIPLGEEMIAVTGMIRDIETNDPLEGAEIFVDNFPLKAFSDQNGVYTLFVPTLDNFSIHCEKIGYTSQSAFVFADEQPYAVRNFDMIAGAMGTVSGTITLFDGTPAANAQIEVDGGIVDPVQADQEGLFSIILPAGNLYTIRSVMGPLTAWGSIFVNQDDENQIDLVLDEAVGHITGPDEYGYIAIEDTDSHEMAPAYEWIEIDPDQGGAGTRVPMDPEDTPYLRDLPFDFQYYGEVYNQFTVNENGFFSLGDVTDDPAGGDYSNSEIPSDDGPSAMIAPFWEDFRANATNFSFYHETEQDLFILEWYNSRQFPVDATFETFQVILYDPAVYETNSGDGMILFQYEDVNDLGNATVGIESPDETTGLGLMYFDANGDGGYAESMHTIINQTSILFYRPSADIAGTVSLTPGGDLTTVSVIAGQDTVYCDENGAFSFPNRKIGAIAITVEAPGYESITSGLTLQDGDVIDDLAFNLWQIQPPENLTGTNLGQVFQVAWENPAVGLHNPNRNELDDFLGLYRVYYNGSMADQTDAQFYNFDLEDLHDGDVFWVTALYDGGESDTSNHVTYIPGGGGEVTMDLPLQGNYFELISFYVQPQVLNALDLFGVIDNLTIVYQADGGIFLPPFINTIGDVDLTQGYQVFCSENSQFTVSGPLVEPMVYQLTANRWNWLGYPYDVEMPADVMLADLEDVVAIILTDDGRMWLPPNVNTIGNMIPGEGYFVFPTEDYLFQYPEGVLMGMTSSSVTSPFFAEDAPRPTGRPYALLVTMDDGLRDLQPTTVSVYDGDLLVGKSLVDGSSDPVPVIAWQGDTEHNVPGFTVGHPIQLILENEQGEKLPVRLVQTETPTFGEGAFADLTLEYRSLPTEFRVDTPYPNPFNPSVTVPFALPGNGEVNFTVYNLMGQKVFEQKRNLQAGYHRFLFDASQGKSGTLGSGIYFLQVQFAGQMQTRKVMMLK